MKTIPVIAPPKKPQPRAIKPRRQEQTAAPEVEAASESSGQPGAQGVFLHDVLNQLQIISLACFELHDQACAPWTERQRKSIAVIEHAIQEAAGVVHKLSSIADDKTAKTNDAVSVLSPSRGLPANNVYPISPYLNRH